MSAAFHPGHDDLDWLVASFVANTPEVIEAIVVSADGLLIAKSPGLDRTAADQFSAIASGLISLGKGASKTFGGGRLHDVVVQLEHGLMFVTRVSDASGLAVLATAKADGGLIAHEMGRVAERVGPTLTPDVVAGMRAAPASA